MTRGHLMPAITLAALAVAWGALPLIVRADVPATQLVAMRVWLGALALLGGMAATRRLRFPIVMRGRLVLAGLLLTAHWTSMFIAVKQTTVAVALAIMYVGPVLSTVAAGPILGERVGMKVRLGLVVAVVGTLFVIRPGSGATIVGGGAALVAAGTLAALFIVGKPAAQVLGSLTVATAELVVASVILTPWAFAAVTENAGSFPLFLLLGVVFTGAAYAVFWSSARVLPVAVTGVLMYIEPASAVVWAAVVLSEHPEPIAWIGVGLVIVGGVFAALDREEVVDVAAAL